MGKYGNVAVMATQLYETGQAATPNIAWDMAAARVFPSSKTARKKGCPRAAYLGLCEKGIVSGIPAGNYSRSLKNKGYALKALEILKVEPALSSNYDALWELVMEGEHKIQNHQMDVVVSLLNNGVIHS